ncbi:MAG: hypothetical protein SNJ84_07865 [Verrucomicrobiia bacterium]
MSPFLLLVLFGACLAAGLTFLLGFVPVQYLRAGFFTRHALVAGCIWLSAAAVHFNLAFLFVAAACSLAWWNFRADHILQGKLFLALAAGLGLTYGIFGAGLIRLPPLVPAAVQHWVIVGVYASAGLLAAGYLTLATAWSCNPADFRGRDLLQRQTGILIVALIARSLILGSALYAVALHPDSGPLLGELLNPGSLGWVLALRILCGLIIPALVAGWILTRLRRTQDEWEPKLALPMGVSLIIGELIALRLGF